MAKNTKRVIPGKEYKVTFGVIQTEKINKAANTVDETPKTFLVNSTLKSADKFVSD